jgi:hypothetical protein
MDDQNLDDILRKDVDAEINKQIHKCFLKWGIEGTLEKIEYLYFTMPELKEKWLTHFWKIVRGK